MAQKYIDSDPTMTPQDIALIERAKREREAVAMYEAQIAASRQRFADDVAA